MSCDLILLFALTKRELRPHVLFLNELSLKFAVLQPVLLSRFTRTWSRLSRRLWLLGDIRTALLWRSFQMEPSLLSFVTIDLYGAEMLFFNSEVKYSSVYRCAHLGRWGGSFELSLFLHLYLLLSQLWASEMEMTINFGSSWVLTGFFGLYQETRGSSSGYRCSNTSL